MIEYDVIVVGAGLFGSVIAYRAKELGMRVLVLEKRSHVGGNIYDENNDGILVHKYGPHIFHTNDKNVWKFVNKFANFRQYNHKVFAKFGNDVYTLPFNLHTFKQIYPEMVPTPSSLSKLLENEHKIEYYENPKNLEEKCVNLIGRKMYEILVKGYTEKQWGCSSADLPPEIITRIPVRNSFDNSYFNDIYQGIPEEGFTKMIVNMLNGIEVKTCVDFDENKDFWLNKCAVLYYTGAIDKFCNYKYGPLGWRSLKFEEKTLYLSNFQGCPVLNYTEDIVPYTRIIEHKHFYWDKTKDIKKSILTYEYPDNWEIGKEAYYPINNSKNDSLYEKYLDFCSEVWPKVRFGGRLGGYSYLDMDDTIKLALKQ